jgi:hypothetical protein
MTKRNKIILAVALGIFLIIIGIGITAAIWGDSSESSGSSGMNPALYTAMFLPMITTFIVYMQPTSPVNNAVYVLSTKKYDEEKRAKYIEFYITRDFKKSEKYKELIRDIWPKYKKSVVKEKGQDKSTVTLELVTGEKFEFEVVKRTKENSVSQSSLWLIKDYTRI